MDVDIWVWAALAGFVALALTVDLLAFGGRAGEVSLRRAAGWSIAWTALGVAFAALLWAWQGREPAGEYLAGFVIEKSLSIDNLFVFAVVFATFGVPPALQRRALYWGIAGAIALRAVFIVAGAALLDAFHATIYVFGAFLVVTGIRLLRHRGAEVDPSRNPVLRLLRRVVPSTDELDGDRFVTRVDGRRVATPLVATLALIATFDVVFALDSIPAIFAVTRETFLVFAANAFSLLGLAALYFLLAGMLERFRYLNVGLAAVLVFVGLKMTLAAVVHVPILVSLGFIVLALGTSVAVSLLRPGAGDGRRDTPARGAPAPTEARP
jgi:tellurite resistance protein TerC